MNSHENEISKDQPRIRPIDGSHIADLIRIGNETNLSHWSAEGYLEELKNPDAIMLRLEDDENATIGFVVGRFVLGGAIESIVDAEIYNIAVKKPDQKKGFGQYLYDAFAESCRERQTANIWLEVRESNVNAIAFYEKNGFERVQTRPSFYENPRENAVLMRRALE